MGLGNKLLQLRKRENLSQEQLAEKMHVTRQTISNWELEETSPDMRQAKELSKLFQVSLDELVENDIQNMLVEKVSNTERLAGIVIKLLKWIGILFLIFFVINILGLFLFMGIRKEPSNSSISLATLTCSIAENEYQIEIGKNGYFNCQNCDKKMKVYLNDVTDWANIEHGIQNVKTYFTENGGSCVTE